MQTVYPPGVGDNTMGIGHISRNSSIDIMDIVDNRNRNQRSHSKRNTCRNRKTTRQTTNRFLTKRIISYIQKQHINYFKLVYWVL